MITIQLTRSQQMALIDIVTFYWTLQDEPQEFIDCSEDPAVKTRTADLVSALLGRENK